MYRTLVETAPIGLFVLDEDGVLTWANDEFAEGLGLDHEEVVDTPFPEFIEAGYWEEDVIDRYLDVVRDLLSSKSPLERGNFRVRTYPPDGDPQVHDVTIELLPLEDGEFQGTVQAFRDVTTETRYARELERQNERLESFVRVVSHDLRNPLNVAAGQLDIATDECECEYLDTIDRAVGRMYEIVEDVLTIAREGQRVEPDERGPVSLEPLATRCWETVATEDATLDVRTDLVVSADANRLKLAFENLYRNAIEHGRPDVTVTVDALADGTGFFVEDDGPGIPPDEREDVFAFGYSGRDEGTGFGLAIVREIAMAHDWSVTATEGTDGGARVTFTDVDLV